MAEQQLIKTTKATEIEYAPFGSEDKIKLSLAIIRSYIAEPGKNGELPDDRQCMRFQMLCRSRRLNPFEGDAFMIPFFSSVKNAYEWSLVTAHVAFLKRAEVHPEYAGKTSGIIITPPVECKLCEGTGVTGDKTCPKCNGNGCWDELPGDFLPDQINGQEVRLAGGWCKVFYKSKPNPEYQRLKLGTYQKATSNWRQDPAGMICKCAEAAALRSAFPTTIGGLYLREEMQAQLDTTTEFKRPLFGSAQEAPQLENGTSPAAENPPKAAALKPEPDPKNPVHDVRAYCKKAKVPEPVLLDFLRQMNLIEDGVDTLEQLSLISPNIIEMLVTQWADILVKVQEYIQASQKPEASDE